MAATKKKVKKPAVKKKVAGKKPVARKAAASVKKPAVKKPTVKKPVPKKAAAKKPTVKQPSRVASARKAAGTVAGRATGKAMKLAGVGSEAVRKATGKAWDQWLALLDKAGANKLGHKQIAEMVHEKFGVPGWWAQMITVGYEQARNMRDVYQTASGYAANASKTVDIALDRLYAAWSDPRLREYWLPGAPLEVRKSTDNKSMRITWTLGKSSVEVGFYPKGANKSMVAVQHSKLPDAEAVTAQKVYWSESLARLKDWLEAGRAR